MAEREFFWDTSIVEKIPTEKITAKFKAFVPDFEPDSFIEKTKQYISSEDLSEAEYYPRATFTEEDEDFIWMACEVLWKRLVPERPPVEQIGDVIDNILDILDEAKNKKLTKKLMKLSSEAFDLVYRNIVVESPSGYALKTEYYEKLQRSTLHDIDDFLFAHLLALFLQGEHERVIELSGILGETFRDDTYTGLKARTLFILRRLREGEDCFKEIISRNPGVVWFPVQAGDCFMLDEVNDPRKAGYYFAMALDIARNNPDTPENREVLYFSLQSIIGMARETGQTVRAELMQNLLDSMRGLDEQAAKPGKKSKVGRNDPCPCGSGRKYKHCCGAAPPDPSQGMLFNPEAFERHLQGITQLANKHYPDSLEDITGSLKEGNLPEWIPETPLEKAQELIYSARETPHKARRLKLAEKALELSPDCADAYVIMAEDRARNISEACSFYRAGVEAGERALGKKFFKKEAGHFWEILSTRPYMRARAGMAECLRELGKHEEALEHFHDMLRLNPNDNQGIRYLLAGYLLERGDIDSLEKLMDRYDEAGIEWLYTRALVSFLRKGDTPEARIILLSAIEENKYVPEYLSKKKSIPKAVPDYVITHSRNEAVVYISEFGAGWLKTPGAVAWLCSVVEEVKTGRNTARAIPKAFIKAFEKEITPAGEKTASPEYSIYTLKVSLQNAPDIWRIIEIRTNQTLHQLHKAVFKAFDRFDEHLYAFFMNNKPWDESSEYGVPHPESSAKNAQKTKIGSLNLKPKKKFLYLFDFGDEWWHTIQVLGTSREEPAGRYPRLTESHGESPPQYPDEEE